MVELHILTVLGCVARELTCECLLAEEWLSSRKADVVRLVSSSILIIVRIMDVPVAANVLGTIGAVCRCS